MSTVFVTKPQLDRANVRVTKQLSNKGLWTPALHDNIDVYLTPVGLLEFGWQWYGGSGNIYIPQVSAIRAYMHFTGEAAPPLSSILRHEWAHALAHVHPETVQNDAFVRAFGGEHDKFKKVADYHPDVFVSKYAATYPMEDFAETFAIWMRVENETKLAKRFQKPKILKKFRFCKTLKNKLN